MQKRAAAKIQRSKKGCRSDERAVAEFVVERTKNVSLPRAPRVRLSFIQRFWKKVRAWYNKDTRIELNGFKPTEAWAAQSAAHAVWPDFPKEFGAPPAAACNLFSPRRRFEIRSNFDIVFALDTKRIFASTCFVVY